MIEAVAQGNKAALAVDKWLQTGKLERVIYRPKRHDVAQCVDIEAYAGACRACAQEIPAEWRGGFVEVEIGFDERTAQEEAKRCLRCDLEWLECVGEPLPQAVESSETR